MRGLGTLTLEWAAKAVELPGGEAPLPSSDLRRRRPLHEDVKMLALLTASSGLTGLGQALRVGQIRAPPSRPASIQEMNRRHVLLAGAAALPLMGSPLSAVASGGATAGKTTSIPRAKLRYYDRITAAVAEFESLNGALGEAGALKKAYGSFFSEVDGSAWMELKGAGFLLAGASQMGSRTLLASSLPATLLSTDREARARSAPQLRSRSTRRSRPTRSSRSRTTRS